MDRLDSTTRQQVEDFQRNLDAMTAFYERQAVLAGIRAAKKHYESFAPARRPPVVVIVKRAKEVTASLLTGTAVVALALAAKLTPPEVNPIPESLQPTNEDFEMR